MNRPSLPSSPPSQPSPYRYLGSGGNGDRPVRLQIVIALVAALILAAVPLYLWRRPRPESIPSADAAVASAATLPIAAPPPPPDGGTFTLSPFKTIACQNPGRARRRPSAATG
ncbi:MAG: hypothetical protein WKG00_38795 [Polyangiaceae bacterium]